MTNRWEVTVIQKICVTALFVGFAVVAYAQAPSEPGKPLPPGSMKAKVKATCTQCHAPDRITEQHLSRSEWSAELEKMEGLGAVIPDADRKAILDYLARNFGPQKSAPKAAPKAATPAN